MRALFAPADTLGVAILLAAILAGGTLAPATGAPAPGHGAPAGEDDPALVGQWSLPAAWPVIGIHAALLPTGTVLYYSFGEAYLAGGHDHDLGELTKAVGYSSAMVWDPVSGVFNSTLLDTDIFCSALSLLPNGKLFVAGGNVYPPMCPENFQGRDVTFWFDGATESWTPQQNMSVARWYPTSVTLGDGTVIILGGLNDACALTPVMERYSISTGISVVPEGARFVQLYPRFHVLSSGKVAHVAPEAQTMTFDPVALEWEAVAQMNEGARYDAPSVLLPGSTDVVMVIGGNVNGGPRSACEKIDFGAATPEWTYTAPMAAPRKHHNAVLLPDGNVFVVGGGLTDQYGNPLYRAEMYDPAADEWTLLPRLQYGRMYHSTALLIPDGRVVVAGQDSGLSAVTGEIYEPPYLFRGARPVIDAAPGEVMYGEEFVVGTEDAASVTQVVLMGLSTVTHSNNNGQRHLALEFAQPAANELLVTAPAHGNLAPPGHYMLFILNGSEVPSVAAMVRVDATRTPVAPPAPPGDAASPFALRGSPNPVSGSSRLTFELPRAAAARLRVVDVAGRTVRTLIDGVLPAGRNAVTWDGRNTAGDRVASGRYIYALSAGGREERRALVMVR